MQPGGVEVLECDGGASGFELEFGDEGFGDGFHGVMSWS